ncbi:hypothetical protein V5N11_033309 [Cardamine amara subsp. amara]|uniref:SAP domain-containing protein n=1 Tax=Cardamine amara subsp. amara TaxID=228776 RepID=A0ABD0ZRF9_CARAN
MDFHKMKRKDLQTLCKKHGIPGNLKNIEMATRLASVFKKETVNLPEDSVEGDGIKDDVVVSKEAKRVRFSPQNEVFEFTRSVKKCQRKSVRMHSQGHVQDLQQGGIELRRSKRIVAKGIQVDTEKKKDELVKNNVKDISMDVQEDPKVKKVSRLSCRFVNDIDVQTNAQDRRRSIRLKARAANSSMGVETSDGRPLCSAKEGKKETKTKQSEGSTVVKSQEGKESLIDCDVSKVEKVSRRPKRLRKDINVLMDKRPVKAVKREKSLSEFLEDGQAQKGAKQPKRTSGNDREDKKLLRSSAIDCEPDGSSVDNVKKSNVNDEMQVQVRFARNYLRHDSSEAPIVVEKKTDETLEKAGGTNVASGGSSRKSKTMNQECVKDMPHGMIEISPSSSETKAAESVMVIENVLDSTSEKPVDSSQRTNTQELNSELVEGKREEKLEHDAILMMPVIEEDKEEVSSRPVLLIERLSPASVQLAVSNPEVELVVPSRHNLVKVIASTAIAEENTKTKEKTLICTPKSELKECNSVAKLAKAEKILENAAECWKEINPRKDDEKGSLENKLQAANLHGRVFDDNTENNSAEEEIAITKNGYVSVGPFVSLTPEKLLDEYSQLKPEEAGGANVEARSSSMEMKTGTQELVKDHPQGIAEKDSPSTSKTKATEPVMISENVLDSTLKSSVDIAPVRTIQELDSELLEEEREEKHEQGTVLMAAGKEKDGASSLSVFLIERSEVSNPEVELFVEITPLPASVQLAVSNHEVELGVSTAHMLLKDIASTVITNEDIKTKEEIPIYELKEHSFVATLAEAAAILENSAEIRSSKDDEKGSLEKKIQAETIHGNFSEYNSENSKVGCISVGHSGNLESLEKTERTISCESGCKLNELELRRWSSTDFTSISPKEDTISKCFEEDEIKALSQPLPSNKDVTVFDESAIFTTPERNLMLMEQLSENGMTTAANSVTHDKDEAVESHVVVFTTPTIVEAGKEEDDTATNFPDESDAPNTTERYSMLEGSRQNEARNEGECKVIELHDESDIATSQVCVEEFKGDRIGRNEENRTIELQHESGTCTSLKTHELFGSFGQNKARESVQFFYEGSGLSTGLHRDQPLADSELVEAGWQEINSVDKSGLLTSLETHLVSGESEQKKAVKTGEKADEEFCDESDVPNIPERQPFTENSELDEAAKSEEDKAVELQVDCDIFTSAEKHLLLETDEEMKGDNMTTNSHLVHDVFIASESQSHMGEFEPDEAEKTNRENMNVDLLGESNPYNNPESHRLLGDSGVDETKKIKDHTAATCEESFVFTSPERQQILVNSEPHSDGKEERNEVEFKDESAFFSKLESGLVLGESGQAGPDQSHHSSTPKFDFRENTIADSSGSMASKVSYNHEFNVGAELMKKGSQAEDVDSLDATQGKSKKNSEHSPHVDSVNLLDFDIEEAETIMEAERNVLCGSNILALPIEGNSQTVGEISSYLEVAGTCSMVSEGSGPFIDVQNQIHDAMEELALTDNTEAEADELIEAGGSYVSGKTCVLAGAENEHLSLNSEVEFRNTCEKSVPKFLKDEAADSIATAFEKAISVSSDELIVQNNMNEKAADEEMIRRETTPSPEETLHDSSENKEYLNIDESGEKQVRREPILIYRTQVKLKRHDMKENAPNSKIVDNLNVTAPRTSKRQPLQDLRKN